MPCWGCPGCAPLGGRGIAPASWGGSGSRSLHLPQATGSNPCKIQSCLWQSCSLLVQDAESTAVQLMGRCWQQESAWQTCICGRAYLREGREEADHFALTGCVFRFLADSAYKGHEWLQLRYCLSPKPHQRLCGIMKSCCQMLQYFAFSRSPLLQLLSQNNY